MYKWTGLVITLVIVICFGVGFFVLSGKGAGTTYVGILPGADCAGLKTELTLYKDNTYFLKEIYLATRDGDKAYASFGRWQKIKSGKRDVIQLNYDKPQELYNFLQKDPDHVVAINKELRDIDCPMNLSLNRKK